MDLYQKLKMLWVLPALVACTVSMTRGQILSCLPPNATSPANPPAQPNLPDSFRVKVEVTVEGRNYTEQAEEIVDNAGNRAVLTTLSQGSQTTAIFNYATQEIFYITGSKCTVRNISSDPERFVFFGETTNDGIGHILDGASALYFGPTIAKVYQGTRLIRGIWCDWWQACISLPLLNESFTLNYYFSEKDWVTPSTFSQVPVRYDVNGTQLMANGTLRRFHRVYDFFDFMQDFDSDPTVFETPEGTVCPGRKSTQTIPPLTNRYFHFREELVDFYHGLISQAEVWYDLDSKLVRVDYRSPDKVPPLDTTHPLSEIHDFNYGVRYVKDLLSGQCSSMALFQDSFDAKFNAATYLVNGSYVMRMKNPISFFFLDSNFTYSGQRTTRDALCDVYISHRYDYDYYNNGSAIEATVETYFLAEGWADVPDDALVQFSQRFPFRVHLWIPKLGDNLVYNVFDFDTERPEISVFDVTDCYNDSNSIRFRVRFPGSYRRDTEHMVRIRGQNALATSMQVSPLRVNNLLVENDASFLYLTATLLDRTPALAQFTHLPNAVVEKNDDAHWFGIASASACSDLCVNNADFTCKSFVYCPGDRKACRISRLHVSEGAPTAVSNTCDLYSRTVDTKAPPDLTVSEAYNMLTQNINNMGLSFFIEEDNEEGVAYTAVDAEIIFGRLNNAILPSLTGQFSYRVEIVYPHHNFVSTYDVWYDSVAKLVRYDSRDATAGPPYYTPFTITTIHDFNTGVAYNIDTHRGNCTVTPLTTNNTLDIQALNWTHVHTSGVEVVALKSPLEMLYLDDTYTFTGQKTVRGILCNVFESRRSDFILRPGTQHSVFQFFFQASSWEYEANTQDDITMEQPVQLVIMDFEANELVIYNFYDFNDEHTSFDNFNIAPCFTDNQRIEFVLDFNQTYHPYLDTREWQFRQEVQLLLSSETRVSPLRIQNMQVTYSLDRTYVITTLLGQVSPQMHFAETGTTSPYLAPVVTSQHDVVSCAASCYYSHQIVCNSFDLCPDQSCYLSTRHVPDGNVTNSTAVCRHFSRLVNGTVPEPQLEDAFTAIKDVVYKGFFTVTLPTAGGAPDISYTATGVRDDILRQTPPTETGGADLHTKFRLYKTGSQMSKSAESLSGMAVDECATACLDEDMFTCDTFSYCYTTGDCYLNTNRPSTNQDLIVSNPYCDLYTRLYLDGYAEYPGQVVESRADNRVKVSGVEECARQCSITTAFTCRSFDFCPLTGHCLLRHVHILDTGARVSNSSTCTHYSRSYLRDFSLQVQVVVPGHDETVINGVGAATCAYQCVNQPSCRSFEFCSGQCRLSSVLPTPSTATHSDSCDLYTLTVNATLADRGTTPRGPVHINRADGGTSPRSSSSGHPAHSASSNTPTHLSTDRPVKPSASPSTAECTQRQTSSGVSDDTGPRVGIAMGVLVVGLLLGAGLVLLVQRVQRKRQDDAALELVPRMR